MKRQTLVYKVLNTVVLLSVVFGVVPPAMAAPISQATPTAPSELASGWPSPESPTPDTSAPFPDPTTLDIEKALEGVEFEVLDSGSIARPAPLKPGVSSTHLPTALDPTDFALERALGGVIASELFGGGLARLEPLTPYSPLSTGLSRPSVSLPAPPEPLTEMNTNLPQPSDLAALAERAEAAEETLDFNGAKEDDTGSESATASTNTDAQLTESEDTLPAIELDFSISDSVKPPAVVENGVTPATEQLAPSAALSDTTIYLPIVISSGEDTPAPTPPPTPSDQVTITHEEGGTLISSDGLMRVDVSADATDEPFTLSYFAPQTDAQRGTDGFFTLEATTQDGKPVVLKRAAHLSMSLPDQRSGRPLVFRQRTEGQQRTVSVGAYVVPNTIAAADSQPSTREMLSAFVYEFGQFTFASLFKSPATQGLAVQDNSEENPDEGDDGLVITSFCREPGTQGPEYTFSEVTVYTSTEEADPWAYLDIFWAETTFDDEGNPVTEVKYDEHGTYREDQSKIDYSNEPEVVIGMEEVGPHTPGKVLSFTLMVDDFGGPNGSYRYDTMDEGTFQAGFKGCVSGSCEAVAPTINAIRISQSGQHKNSSFGTCWVSVDASDNAGTPSLSLTFNGIQYTNFQSLPDDSVGVEVTECYVNDWNYMQVTAVDDCGNTSTTPEFPVWGTGAISFGCSAYSKNCGYQGSSADPVNTSNGNYFDQVTDIVVAGVDDTDLVIERAYNSMAVLWTGATEMEYSGFDGAGGYTEEPAAGPPQYFGLGWTFPYATYLLVLDKAPFYTGVQIQYADGRTVNFVKEGDGYVPDSPANFDTLTKEGDEYVLRHTRTLEVERFNADGQLIAKEDRNGNRITLTYDGELLARVENDSGRWLEFDYNADGLIETIRAPEGKTLHHGYTDGLLTSFTDGRGNTTTYDYSNEQNMLTTITTPKGHTSLEQTYDEKNRVNWQKMGQAEINAFTYSEDGLVTTITDSYNNATTYTHNEFGQLMQITDALGYTEEFDYDEDYNRIYYKDKEDREWHYTLNESGMRTAEDGPMGWHQEWDYNDPNLATYMQDALGRETSFDYNAKGKLIKITNALSDTSSITYDERGLPTSVRDFNDNETVNTYDPLTGDLLQTRNGAGDEVAFTYDDLGRLKTMTNGRGFVYTYTYDGNDNLSDVDGPIGYHLGYEYDANDNLIKEIDPNGGETEYFYDESENLIRVENQLDFPTIYEYDDMNNLVRLEDAEGRVWTYEYDAVYNRIAEHGPEDIHTFYAYDGVGNLTDETRCNSSLSGDTCPEKQVTHYKYDDLDRVTQMIQNHKPGADKTPGTNVTTEYKYDLVGNLLTLTDANGNHTIYEYDDLDRLIYEEDAEEQETEYGYDDMGNLISLVNPRDYGTTFTYDGANRLETTTDALSNTWTYAYDGNGNLTDTTDPLGVVTHNEYDELDRLSSVTLNFVVGAPATVDQNVTTRFEYDLAGNLRFVYDPRGTYQTEHRYDAAHRRVLTIDVEGGETEFGYDRVNNLVSLMDANDHETTFEYDGLDRQVKVTNPEGHSVRFEYDRLSNLRVLTDARGNPTIFTYDGMNRLVLRVDALLGQWVYEYDAMGNLLRYIDANGHANNTYTYDKVYRLETSTDAEEYVTSFTYDENGNMRTLTDGNYHVTEFTYDELDRLASVTNAENETTRYQYDPLGNQTHLIEADEIVTLYGYDPLYRLTSVTQNYRPGLPENADTNVDTHYGYDEVGNLLSILDAEEHETSFSYDGLNRLTQEVDALGNTWDYEYDFVGNRTVRIDANRDRTEYEYYPDNQLKHISYYDGTSVHYTYDENNNRLTMVDHLGMTTWVYDALNRVTDVTDPFDRHLGYAYDPVSNRIGLTYADGRTVNYTYYDNNWLKTVVDPEGNVTSYERDGVGQVTRTTNPNSTISTMRYDKVDRLLTLVNYQVEGAAKTNSAFSYTYDEVGQRTQMVAEYAWRKPNEILTSNYTYDSLRRLIRDEDTEGAWTEYTFDRVGNRLTLRSNDSSLSTRPFDELIIFYTYNDINQLLTTVANTPPSSPGLKRCDNVTQPLHAFRHEVAAQRGRHITEAAADNLLTMADALIADLYANPVPKVAEVAAAIQALRDQVTTDRASGAIDSDGIANSLLVKLDWGDEANNGADKEFQTTTYLYDDNGNRVNKEFPGPQGPRVQGTDYTYDPENRLVVAHDYQMNLQGNRVDRQITRLEYNGDGWRLVKEYDPKDGPSTSSGQAGGGTKRVEYVFDGLDPVAEYNLWNPQYENFYRGDLNRIITMHHFPSGTQGQMYWFHYDGLGSTSGLTKHHGQSHHNYRYEPYGQIEMPPGNFTDPHNHYTFTGKEWDEHTELYYFGARHYDPIVGVWLTKDTYRGQRTTPASFHRYQYVYGNPISYYDPDGHWPKFIEDTADWVSDKASDAVEWASEKVSDTAEWVGEHKEEIATAAVGVVAVAGVAAFCVGTAGVGCAIAAAGAAAYAGTVGYNVATGNEWHENVIRNTGIAYATAATIAYVGPTAITWGTQVVAPNAAALLTTGGLSYSAATTIGAGIGYSLAGTYIAGMGMFVGGMTCAWYDSECLALMGTGGALASGAYGVGELINYAASCLPPQRGANNPTVRNSINTGNRVHYDQFNGGTGVGGPSKLQKIYPRTQFGFARRGQGGVDVTVVGGQHPSTYSGSNWPAGVNHADFKPYTQSGMQTFIRDVDDGKLPQDTIPIYYDPNTGDIY